MVDQRPGVIPRATATDPTLVVAGVVVDARGRVLAARRSYPESLAGRWEFPGGKAAPDETPQQALVRELDEELGIRALVGDEVVGPDHGHWPINEELTMRAYWCQSDDVATHTGRDHDQLVWVGPQDLPALAWLPADVALAETVAHHLLHGPASARGL
ncbi:(deoxy)nucleoside triphosphate pyrophosphohydrolase [Tessaracoccus sp. SD287]|uniref:(deoxy)nucleoside triphosphate pyrophosphohydrolase n=1 Tax=Tessaracoccus sp. SD287 TaxID=2782008 RepID=UPI001A967A08|nr:(deoxy)nucleoside triphosphate pyrophosphohydrolase [Tessaracoccus sp. SD287]MBO1032055.1 (deoxy)nucleoside triphosphate pyrophosphohydrolase [Tessaracoccus sp. SD287]